MALTQRTHDFTTIMVFNKGSAIGALRALQDRGLTVRATSQSWEWMTSILPSSSRRGWLPYGSRSRKWET